MHKTVPEPPITHLSCGSQRVRKFKLNRFLLRVQRWSLGGRVQVELDLPNYATKADLKTATGVGTQKSAKNVD